jgi:hypothetical protein
MLGFSSDAVNSYWILLSVSKPRSTLLWRFILTFGHLSISGSMEFSVTDWCFLSRTERPNSHDLSLCSLRGPVLPNTLLKNLLASLFNKRNNTPIRTLKTKQ